MYDLQTGCNQRASHLLHPPSPAPLGWGAHPQPTVAFGVGAAELLLLLAPAGRGLVPRAAPAQPEQRAQAEPWSSVAEPGPARGAELPLPQPGGPGPSAQLPRVAAAAACRHRAALVRLHNAKLAFRFLLRDRLQ